MEKLNLLNGNNIELLKTLEENSVDSIITDPPYGLSFMGKKWDYDVPSTDFWKEVLRVLKPGGHVLSFGGTRTYHRMVVNMEDAGFEIRDQIMWLYGSGFPKSHNIGKAIDAMIKTGKSSPSYINKSEMSKTDGEVVEVIQPNNGILGEKKLVTKMIGASLETDEAIKYEGWGTALKPANEPICLARKPIEENTIAKNVIKWGTGGINIDECRVGTDIISTHNAPKGTFAGGELERGSDTNSYTEHEGRFPANLILDETAAELLDEQSGKKENPSRFFYSAKVSKKERNMGLDEFEDKQMTLTEGKGRTYNDRCANCKKKFIGPKDKICNCENPETDKTIYVQKNNHPTVKPIQLMTYLCRLITPKGGTILDPFMGSGSTGISALLEGFNFVGMEMDENYFKIAETRINNYEKYGEFLKK